MPMRLIPWKLRRPPMYCFASSQDLAAKDDPCKVSSARVKRLSSPIARNSRFCECPREVVSTIWSLYFLWSSNLPLHLGMLFHYLLKSNIKCLIWIIAFLNKCFTFALLFFLDLVRLRKLSHILACESF